MLRSHTQPRERLENSYRTTPATAAEGDWRRLKGDLQIRDIPVIVLSAHALAGERERAIAAGCDEFDTTPIEFDRLVANAAACSRAPQVRLPSGCAPAKLHSRLRGLRAPMRPLRAGVAAGCTRSR
jgi:DNA-binding NtrC family response regulator